jgi:hypothetical protein
MKKIIILLILIFITFCKKEESKSEATTTQKPITNDKAIIFPKTIVIKNPILPNPPHLLCLKELKGNLDEEEDEELVLVYESKEIIENTKSREIHIYKKKNSKWHLFFKTKGPILTLIPEEKYDELLEDITIENKVLSIKHIGGKTEKWQYIHDYKLIEGKWFLISVNVSFGEVCDRWDTYTYDLQTGSLNEEIEFQSCNENSKINTKSRLIKNSYQLEKKTILMDGYLPGSRTEKISSKFNDTIIY